MLETFPSSGESLKLNAVPETLSQPKVPSLGPVARNSLLAAFFLFTAVHFLYLDKYPIFWLDDIGYSEPAWTFMKEGHFGNSLMLSPRAFPGTHYEVTNVGMGRISLFTLSAFYRIFGFGPYQSRLPQMISGIVSILLLFLIGRTLFNGPVAATAAILWATSHVFFVTAHQSRPDMMAILFILAAVYAFLEAEKRGSLFLFFLSGLIAGLNVDVHAPGLVAFGALAGAAAVDFRKIKASSAVAAALGAGLGCLWWIFFHYYLNRSIFWDQWNSVNGQIYPKLYAHFGITIKNEFNRYFQFYWEGKFHRNMALFALFLVSGAAAFFGPWRKPALKTLAMAAGLELFMLLFVPNKLGYTSYIVPLLMLLAAHFLYSFSTSIDIPKKAGAFAFIFLIAVLFIFENGYKLYAFQKADFKGYLAKIKSQVPESSTDYGPAIGLYGYMSANYYADHNHMWDSFIYQDQKAERVIQALEELRIEYVLLDEGVYPIQCLPDTERARNFRGYIEKNFDKVGQFTDRYYGRDWYNFLPKGPEFLTQIYRRKDRRSNQESAS